MTTTESIHRDRALPRAARFRQSLQFQPADEQKVTPSGHSVERGPMSSYAVKISVLLVFVGISAVYYGTLPEIGFALQIVGAGSFLGAAAILLPSQPRSFRLTPYELVGFVTAFVSLAVNLSGYAVDLDPLNVSLPTTILLFPMIFSWGILARGIPVNTQLQCFAACLGINGLIAAVLNRDLLLLGIAGLGGEYQRYKPFGFNPNLMGMAFTVGLILSVYLILDRRHWVKVCGLVFAVVQALSIIATGSRGAVVGLLAALLIVILTRWAHIPRTARRMFSLGFALALLALAAKGVQLLNYLLEVFAVYSKDRGIGTGATGRADQWIHYPSIIMSSAPRMLFGTGLRTLITHDVTMIVDSSYLGIALQSGLPIALAVATIMIITCWRMYLSQSEGKYGLEKFVIFMVVIQVSFSSIFISGIFSVGNASSYINFMLFVVAWLIGGSQRNDAASNHHDPRHSHAGSAGDWSKVDWRALRDRRRSLQPQSIDR